MCESYEKNEKKLYGEASEYRMQLFKNNMEQIKERKEENKKKKKNNIYR